MFEDYGKFEHPDWLLRLCRKEGADMSFFEIKELKNTKELLEQEKYDRECDVDNLSRKI